MKIEQFTFLSLEKQQERARAFCPQIQFSSSLTGRLSLAKPESIASSYMEALKKLTNAFRVARSFRFHTSLPLTTLEKIPEKSISGLNSFEMGMAILIHHDMWCLGEEWMIGCEGESLSVGSIKNVSRHPCFYWEHGELGLESCWSDLCHKDLLSSSSFE